MPSHNKLSIRHRSFSWTAVARDFADDKSTERFRRKSTAATAARRARKKSVNNDENP